MAAKLLIGDHRVDLDTANDAVATCGDKVRSQRDEPSMVAGTRIGGYDMIVPPGETAQRGSEPVLVVIPCLNEAGHIGRVLTKLAGEADRLNLRIVVADGGSTDQTRAIVGQMADADGRILLMDNKRRIQSSAVNGAVQRYGEEARFLIRVDAHCDYPYRYCEHLMNVRARTRADSVVVSMRTQGRSCFERAAAAAQNSILGNGGSSHRLETGGRWVDHGHHALMTIKAFKAVGGYDETFSHNEDAELDARLTENGFRIYLTDETQVTYYPRGSPFALFRQYFNIGRGRARNFLKHRKTAKLRHLVLAAVAPILCISLLVPISPIFALPAVAWILVCLGYGIVLGIRLRDTCAAAAGLAAIATQAGWSFGFFAGLKAGLAEAKVAKTSSGARETPTDRIAG